MPIIAGGQIVYVPGGTGQEEMEWPMPVGKLIERICGRAGPVTLPRYIKKGLKKVTCKGAMMPGEVNEFFVFLGSLGLASVESTQIGDVTATPFDFMRHFLNSDAYKVADFYKNLIEQENSTGPNFELRVEVKGERNGRPINAICTQIGLERNAATYIPAWILFHMGSNWPDSNKRLFMSRSNRP